MLSFSMQDEVERAMMGLGSGVITDLDRFMMPDLDGCDMDGHEIVLDELGDRIFD